MYGLMQLAKSSRQRILYLKNESTWTIWTYLAKFASFDDNLYIICSIQNIVYIKK